MKKTRILSFLLVFAMLCGLVCIPATAEVNSADDWQLADGWELNPFIFTFKNQEFYNPDTAKKATNPLTFTDPDASTDNVGDWSMSTDIYFDAEIATPNQRMTVIVETVAGDTYSVRFQRRFAAKNLQVGVQLNGSWMKAGVNEATDGAIFSTGNSSEAMWSNSLTAVKDAVSACTNFRLTLQSVEGLLTLTVSDINNGAVLFEMVEESAGSYANKEKDAVKSVSFSPDMSNESDGTTPTNYFDITNIQTAVDGVASTAVEDIANYTWGDGWTYAAPGNFELKVDNSISAGTTALNNATIPANAGFELKFNIDYLKNDVDARTVIDFYVDDVWCFARVARRDDKLMIRIQTNKGGWVDYYNKWTNTVGTDNSNRVAVPTEVQVTVSRAQGANTLVWKVTDANGNSLLTSDSSGILVPIDSVTEGSDDIPLSGEVKNLKFYGEKTDDTVGYVGAWKYTNMSWKYTQDGTNWTNIESINNAGAWTLGKG